MTLYFDSRSVVSPPQPAFFVSSPYTHISLQKATYKMASEGFQKDFIIYNPDRYQSVVVTGSWCGWSE